MRWLSLVLSASLMPLPALARTEPQAASRPMLVSAAELAARLKDPSIVVLHVGDRADAFEEGHIPNAQFLRYGDFAVEGESGLGSELPSVETAKRVFEAAGVSDAARVVIYAQSPVLAARAFFTLDAFGHADVALLNGGLRAWRDAKLPIETGPAKKPAPVRFSPRLQAQRLADAAMIQQQVAANRISLVDVRPDPEFFGTDGGMNGMHAAGHIDGARQLTWNSLVDAEGRFLPAAQLRQRLEAAGVVGGRPVVAYCMVGMRASVVYFAARYLGYEARLYDGSIVDWSRRKLPVTAK
jgi:thiosulfate/3-mercaptopyruvate sulfurtransferase